MKKWLFPALSALLLLTAVGCDKTQPPDHPLPDTVDELTVVTTAEETETPTEPPTEPVTEPVSEPASEPTSEPVTEPETAPAETETTPAETEILSPEDAAALLDRIILSTDDREEGPIEVNMTSEVELTAHMFGFSGTTTIPLSSYYAIDGDKDMMIAYAVPMEGTGVCIVANGMLYLHDGAEAALKASLDDASVDEVRAILLERLKKQMGSGLPSITLPQPKDSLFESPLPVPAMEFSLTELLGKAFASVPLEDAFIRVEAVRDPAAGVTTLTLSGISDAVLGALEKILTALPEEDSDSSDATKENGYDKETAMALVALLREQADTAMTLTLTVNDACETTEVSIVTALDLTSLPKLTANMPVEVKISTAVSINRDNITIEEPEDADRYEEVPLSALLPPEKAEAAEPSVH